MNAEQSDANTPTALSPPQDLKARTKQFALRVIRLYSSLPRTTVAQVIGRQLLRAGTSVGAQYSEGRRSRSTAEFVSKLESALQELEETIYWMELLIESGIIGSSRMSQLIDEAKQLNAILTASVVSAKRGRRPRVRRERRPNEAAD